MQIVVATHNEGKLVEIRRILEEDLGADAENIELVSAGSLHLPDPGSARYACHPEYLRFGRAAAHYWPCRGREHPPSEQTECPERYPSHRR